MGKNCLEADGCACMIKCFSQGLPPEECLLSCDPDPALATIAGVIADCIGNACA